MTSFTYEGEQIEYLAAGDVTLDEVDLIEEWFGVDGLQNLRKSQATRALIAMSIRRVHPEFSLTDAGALTMETVTGIHAERATKDAARAKRVVAEEAGAVLSPTSAGSGSGAGSASPKSRRAAAGTPHRSRTSSTSARGSLAS